MKCVFVLLMFLQFSFLCADINSPLRNLYIKQALEPFPKNEKTRDPFDRKFVLPQKSRANLIVTNGIIVASAIGIFNLEVRRKFKERWELITSPNHASPLNQGPFHFVTLEEERAQDTQADKGVHFLYHYLPVKPVAFICEYIIDGFPYISSDRGKKEDWISDEAFYLATFLVFAGGFFEEYVDGKEIDEGFSVLDLAANGTGSVYALMKHNGYLKNVYVYWSYRTPPQDWKWPKWDYMPGFEFSVVVDISSLIFKENRVSPPLFTWWSDNIAYIPDVKKIGSTSTQKNIRYRPY